MNTDFETYLAFYSENPEKCHRDLLSNFPNTGYIKYVLVDLFIKFNLNFATLSKIEFNYDFKVDIISYLNSKDLGKLEKPNLRNIDKILKELFSEININLKKFVGIHPIQGKKTFLKVENMDPKMYSASGQKVLFSTEGENNMQAEKVKEVLNMKDFQPVAKRILVLPQEIKTKYVFFSTKDGFYNRKVSNNIVTSYKKILDALEYSQIILVEDNKKYKVVDGQHRLSAVGKSNKGYYFDALIYPQNTPGKVLLENIHKGKRQSVADYLHMSLLESPFLKAFDTKISEEGEESYHTSVCEVRFLNNKSTESFSFQTLASVAHNLTSYIGKNKNREVLNFYSLKTEKEFTRDGWDNIPLEDTKDNFGNIVPGAKFYREVLEYWFPLVKSIPSSIRNATKYRRAYSSQKTFFCVCLFYYENFYIKRPSSTKDIETLKYELLERFRLLDSYETIETSKHLSVQEYMNYFLKICNYKLKTPLYSVYDLNGR